MYSCRKYLTFSVGSEADPVAGLKGVPSTKKGAKKTFAPDEKRLLEARVVLSPKL
jgi:hypothetical protein